MTPPPVGKHTPRATRTPVYAYVAARLRHVPNRAQTAYFRDKLRISLSQQQAERAAGPIRLSPPRKGQRGRAGERRAKAAPALEEWVLVNERRLGLEKWLVRIEGDGRGAPDLLRRLRRLAGVRQIVETGHRRDIYVLLLSRDHGERLDLRARLEELTDRAMVWDEVLSESHHVAALTWEALAKRTAAEEGL